MRALVIHAPRDLRIDRLEAADLGAQEVRVRVEVGGICGSDLHYFHHGGMGAIRLKEPMVLGHEISGTIVARGAGVSRLTLGARVAVNPSRHCGKCASCTHGLHNHCQHMRFLGSAMRFPHVQGGFRELLNIDETQAFVMEPHVSMGEAAMAEPFAVALHAVNRAGPLLGKRLLVTGCGPIGILTILAARLAGAADITATDIQPFALHMAKKAGADCLINVASEPLALANQVAQTAPFDVLIEASGNASVLAAALAHLSPRAIVVQLGLGGDLTLPMNMLVSREIEMRGSFRFDAEFGLAVEMMNRSRVDVKPYLTSTLPLGQAREAFEIAGDRARELKVQIAFQ